MPELRTHNFASRQSMRAVVASTCQADAADYFISFVGNSSTRSLFELDPNKLAVLRAAAKIEPEPAEVMHWYRTIPIVHLSRLTAEELVAGGRADEVLRFLRAIRDDPVG